jgi:putative ABC transport system substrate-binding protein
MKRRQLIALLSATALLPRWAAPQGKPFRLAWLSHDRADVASAFLLAFREGLRDLGYVEGRNLAIDARWGEQSEERLQQMAAELIKLAPQIIVAHGGQALRVLARANAPLPVVFAFSGDPIEAGVADTLARPGRGMTGVSFLSLELAGKRMELLKQMLPALKRVAIIANPQHPGERGELRVSEAAARTLGLTLEYFQARTTQEIDDALSAAAKARSEAMLVFPDAIVMRHADRFAKFSVEHRIPAVSGWAQFAERGNLAAYGPRLGDSFRRLAVYVDKILKGANVSAIPIELPTTVELVLNARTASALRLTIPPSVMLRADRVIE